MAGMWRAVLAAALACVFAVALPAVADAAYIHPFERQLTGAQTPAGSFEFGSREHEHWEQEKELLINGGRYGGGGLAVNAAGDVYVADTAHHVVDEFDASGHYVGQLTGTPEGPFGETCGVVVDAADQNVYVADFDHNTVDVFSSSGEYLRKVSGTGAPGGQFPAVGSGQCATAIAVDGFTGDLYAGDLESPGNAPVPIDVFGPAGEYLGTFEGSNTKPGVPDAGALAVEQLTGELSVSDGQAVNRFNAAHELVSQLAGFREAWSMAIDSRGDLYVSEGPYIEPVPVAEFAPSGKKVGQLTSEGTPGPFGFAHAIAAGSEGQVYLDGSSTGGTVYVYGTLVTPEVETTAASSLSVTAATLNGEVNPEGLPLGECFFEWGETSEYGNQTACEHPDVHEVGEGSSYVPVHSHLTGLTPGRTYHYRLVAANENGVNRLSADRTFTTGPLIDSTSTLEVTSTSARLAAEIDPEGVATEYRFEYLSEAEYQRNLREGADEGFAGSARVPSAAEGDTPVGAGEQDVAVARLIAGLQPGTVYRYRAIAHSALGVVPGPVEALSTQGASGPALPDGRGWELVSPSEKHGGLILGLNDTPGANGGATQAAASGQAITYLATAPTEVEPPGNSNFTQVLSVRGPDGWSTRDINAPHEAASHKSNGAGDEYRIFSSDLSTGVLDYDEDPFDALLSPAASEKTPYLRTNFASGEPDALCSESCYRPLVTGCPQAGEPCAPAVEALADVPAGTKFGSIFEGASSNLQHIIIRWGAGLYEWSATAPPHEALRPISVLPDGELASGELAGYNQGYGSELSAVRQVSEDGSRVFWIAPGGKKLYLRYNATEAQSRIEGGVCVEASKACTVEIHDIGSFVLASADGSRALLADGCLYDVASGSCEAQLTQGQGGFELLGASEDLSAVYFADNAVLTGGQQNANGESAGLGECRGQFSPSGVTCNLYVYRDGTTTFIAKLSGEDYPDTDVFYEHTSRVSPNGDWLAFLSDRSLTGYDNRDVGGYQSEESPISSGKFVVVEKEGGRVPARDEEVYLYHAGAAAGEGSLICASCMPTGARPQGVINGAGDRNVPLVGVEDAWLSTTWLAATLPGWTQFGISKALVQSRYLSDSGRLFFNSDDALVPQDSNGTWDVYEYEPPGVGDCEVGSATYSASSGGCMALISSGTSASESAFLEASESGNDVFFVTNARLAPRDVDRAYDVYDARVGGGEAAEPKPIECQGDNCQQPVSAPEDLAPTSLLFSGPGDAAPPPPGKSTTKSPTRARRLAAALRACQRARAKRRRHACEASARKKYGSVKKAKRPAKAHKGGK